MTLGLANQRSQATLTSSLWNVVVRMRAPLAWTEKNWSRNDRGGSEPSVLEWQAGERLWERVGVKWEVKLLVYCLLRQIG